MYHSPQHPNELNRLDAQPALSIAASQHTPPAENATQSTHTAPVPQTQTHFTAQTSQEHHYHIHNQTPNNTSDLDQAYSLNLEAFGPQGTPLALHFHFPRLHYYVTTTRTPEKFSPVPPTSRSHTTIQTAVLGPTTTAKWIPRYNFGSRSFGIPKDWLALGFQGITDDGNTGDNKKHIHSGFRVIYPEDIRCTTYHAHVLYVS